MRRLGVFRSSWLPATVSFKLDDEHWTFGQKLMTSTSVAELPTSERGGDKSEEWSEDLREPPFPSLALSSNSIDLWKSLLYKHCSYYPQPCWSLDWLAVVECSSLSCLHWIDLRMSSACSSPDPPNPFLFLFFTDLRCFSASCSQPSIKMTIHIDACTKPVIPPFSNAIYIPTTS